MTSDRQGSSAIEFPSDLEILAAREFQAPIALVFDVLWKPEHLRRTIAPFGEQVTVCDVDLRVGGDYRYVFVTDDGVECSFRGTFLELEPPHRSVQTWLFGIVLNVVRTHRRTLAAHQPHLLRAEALADPETLPDPADGPHEQAARAEDARILDLVLDALDDSKREVFVLAELEQMSAPEIGAALSLPINTVYSRLRHARRQFAQAAARYRAQHQRRTQWTT